MKKVLRLPWRVQLFRLVETGEFPPMLIETGMGEEQVFLVQPKETPVTVQLRTEPELALRVEKDGHVYHVLVEDFDEDIFRAVVEWRELYEALGNMDSQRQIDAAARLRELRHQVQRLVQHYIHDGPHLRVVA